MSNPSYHRKDPIVVTERMRRQIAGAVAELDLAQIAVSRKLTPADRIWQAASMIDAAERVAAYRLCQRDPALGEDESLRIVRAGVITYFKRQQSAKGASSDAR
jgi:hypothetical protein